MAGRTITVFSERSLRQLLIKIGVDDTNVEECMKNQIPLYIISIRGKKDNAIFKEDHANVLNLVFDDTTWIRKDLITFDIDMANQILNFVEQLKVQFQFNLIVQCEAGMSRSGAVGEVLNDYFELSYKDFMKENPQIMPNPLVRSILREAIRDKNKTEEIPL